MQNKRNTAVAVISLIGLIWMLVISFNGAKSQQYHDQYYRSDNYGESELKEQYFKVKCEGAWSEGDASVSACTVWDEDMTQGTVYFGYVDLGGHKHYSTVQNTLDDAIQDVERYK